MDAPATWPTSANVSVISDAGVTQNHHTHPKLTKQNMVQFGQNKRKLMPFMYDLGLLLSLCTAGLALTVTERGTGFSLEAYPEALCLDGSPGR